MTTSWYEIGMLICRVPFSTAHLLEVVAMTNFGALSWLRGSIAFGGPTSKGSSSSETCVKCISDDHIYQKSVISTDLELFFFNEIIPIFKFFIFLPSHVGALSLSLYISLSLVLKHLEPFFFFFQVSHLCASSGVGSVSWPQGPLACLMQVLPSLSS